jgi:hypothetical protein
MKCTTANSTFAIGGVSCSADSFVVAESSALRINICAKKPAHRKSAKRCTQYIFRTYADVLLVHFSHHIYRKLLLKEKQQTKKK